MDHVDLDDQGRLYVGRGASLLLEVECERIGGVEGRC
jgi:hypothetical protein